MAFQPVPARAAPRPTSAPGRSTTCVTRPLVTTALAPAARPRTSPAIAASRRLYDSAGSAAAVAAAAAGVAAEARPDSATDTSSDRMREPSRPGKGGE